LLKVKIRLCVADSYIWQECRVTDHVA
jgi:hypothetical protein